LKTEGARDIGYEPPSTNPHHIIKGSSTVELLNRAPQLQVQGSSTSGLVVVER